ncbi:MAG: polymerase subunit delta', polymerase subunit delta' protein [Candidatus Berkelbacteria bacterium]|nr:polymerase subunit delta', polymerase subunit delta' protein [Candidatus Berkelbacteria bacterium]
MNLLRTINIQIKNSRIGHAYLVIGDFDVEEIRHVLKIQKPDFWQLRENPIKIVFIRELIHWISLKPHSSPFKLAVIWNLENITLEAANALLKVLEEPPKNTIFILNSQKTEKILPTIISRCQIIRFKKNIQKETSEEFMSLEVLKKKSIKERFDFASKIAESNNLSDILNSWENNLRNDLLCGTDVRHILKEISSTRSLLSTNTSVKLLLENLFLNI